MINGFDSYKLSINNLNDVNCDTITSNTDKTSSLYINGVLIDFSQYITSSYLSNYVTTTVFNNTLANYVTNSSLSSTLSNYATYGALSSYRLISDSWSRSDTTNEIVIRTGNTGYNADGSIKTCKTYTDESVAVVAGGVAVNSTAIAGLVAWQSATDATIAGIEGQIGGIEGQIATLEDQVATLETDVGELQTKTQNQTATSGTTNFTGIVNISDGVNNNVVLNETGAITCLTESVNTLTCNTELTGSGKLNLTDITQDHVLIGDSITLSQAGKTTTVYGDTYIGAVGSTVQLYGNNVNIGISNSITNLPVVSIGGIFSTVYLTGAVYVNGTLLVPFVTGSAGGQWYFPNV